VSETIGVFFAFSEVFAWGFFAFFTVLTFLIAFLTLVDLDLFLVVLLLDAVFLDFVILVVLETAFDLDLEFTAFLTGIFFLFKVFFF